MSEPMILYGDEAWLPDEWAALPHGTITGRLKGCHCQDCRAAISGWRRRRRDRIAASRVDELSEPGWARSAAKWSRAVLHHVDRSSQRALCGMYIPKVRHWVPAGSVQGLVGTGCRRCCDVINRALRQRAQEAA